MNPVEQYARWVLEEGNELETGRLIKLAAKRVLSDLERDDIYFDEAQAQKFYDFAEKSCCLWEDKWRGKPVILEPWMKFCLGQAYGWIRKEDGLRRTRKIYIQVAKKNAKSTALAGVPMLYHLYADERVNTPKVFTAANNEDQAKISVNIAGKMVEQSPDLYAYVEEGLVDLFQYKENIINIVHRGKDGFIKALSKESDDRKSKQSGGKHGINASLGVVDEFGMSPDLGATGTISSSMAAREEPLMIYITTAGFNMDGPCYQDLRKNGIAVLEGHLKQDSYLPFIYELDKGDKIFDKRVWKKCNPNLGVSVTERFLEEQLIEAQKGGSFEVDVRTLNFNEWCESPEVWIGKDIWEKNTHGIDESELKYSYEAFAGLEIISGLSLNALVLLFPNVRDGIHGLKCMFWMPEEKILPDRNEAKFDFSDFVKKGYIKTSPGNVIENEIILDWIKEEINKHRVHSLAFNVNLQNHDILQGLVKAGVQCNPLTQSYRALTEPTLAWEEIANKFEFEHFGNPVLAWMNSQCMILRKGNDVMLESMGGRVAGIYAGIRALAQWKTIEANGRFNDEIIESWGNETTL